MRTKRRPIKHLVGWHFWYAWYPIKVTDGCYSQWVWLETVDRKWTGTWADCGWKYRVKVK